MEKQFGYSGTSAYEHTFLRIFTLKTKSLQVIFLGIQIILGLQVNKSSQTDYLMFLLHVHVFKTCFDCFYRQNIVL